MIVILTKPLLIGTRTHKRGTEIDLESNTAKALIRDKGAKKPGVINKIKKQLKKQ